MMTGVLNTTKLSKHFQRAQKKKKKKESTETRTVLTSNCFNKKETFILFCVKHVNTFVSYYQGQTPRFKNRIYLLKKSLTKLKKTKNLVEKANPVKWRVF